MKKIYINAAIYFIIILSLIIFNVNSNIIALVIGLGFLIELCIFGFIFEKDKKVKKEWNQKSMNFFK